MSKAKRTVSEFELALKARSAMFDVDREPSYPFIAGYLLGMLQEFAEDHPKVSKKIAERTKGILENMERLK